MRWWAAAWPAFCLAGSIGLAGLSLRLPPAAGADAPAGAFSASRAMAHVEAVAQRPHPVGSAEHDRVRTIIAERMTMAGLAVESRAESRAGVARAGDAGDAVIAIGHVRNIVATLPGRDRTLPALMLMAHYDTVPHSPGAADDGVGVATLIETARALAHGPRPLRDTIFLFTDGEEAGLFGARHYFGQTDPKRIMAVVNLEARGAGGRAVLFETSPNAYDLVAAYGAVDRPSANSAAATLYRMMPHGTDLSVALDRGIPGLNIAIMGRQAAYHSASAVPAFLDPRSLQHMGDQALELSRGLSARAVPPVSQRPSVWFDLFGLCLVHYPAGFGWIPVLLAAGALAASAAMLRQTGLLSVRAMLAGCAGLFSIIAASGAALLIAGIVTRKVAEQGAGAEVLFGNAGWMFAGLTGVALGTALLLARPERADLPSQWLGALLAGWLLAVAMQGFMPGLAWLPGWTVLAGAVAMLAWRLSDERAWAMVIVMPALGLVLSAAAMLAIAVGIDAPAALAIPATLAVLLLWPLLAQWRALPRAGVAAVALAGAGFAATVAAAILPSPAPVGSEVFLLADRIAGRAFRASAMKVPDRWTRFALAGPQQPEVRQLDVPITRPFHLSPTAMPVSRAPIVALASASNNDGGRLTLRPANGGSRLRIALRPSVALARVSVDGLPLNEGIGARRWTILDVQAVTAAGVVIDFAASGAGAIDVRVLEMDAPWPGTALPLPARPSGVAPAGLSDRMMVLDATRLMWGS